MINFTNYIVNLIYNTRLIFITQPTSNILKNSDFLCNYHTFCNTEVLPENFCICEKSKGKNNSKQFLTIE